MLLRLFTLAFCTLAAGCGLVAGPGAGAGGGTGSTGTDGGSFEFTHGFAFTRAADRNLLLANASDPQMAVALTAAGGVHSPTVCKDGTLVVFVTGSGAGAALSLVPVGGGAVTTLLSSTPAMQNFKAPVFSPDSSMIAFSYDSGGLSTSIALVNTTGTGLLKLAGGDALSYAAPTFSPDGRSVLVAAGYAGMALSQLQQVTIATRQAVTSSNTLGTEALGLANRLTWSADGTKAAFDAHVSSGATRLFVFDLASGAITAVKGATGAPNSNDTWPSWVSAGSLAFSSDSGGSDAVYTSALDGTNRTQLVPNGTEAWYGP
jgi:Tol biopolymer transport system component